MIRNLLIDICIVLLILLMGTQLFDRQQIHESITQKEITQFENQLSQGDTVSTNHVSAETNPNETSLFIQSLSDVSREGMRIFVEMMAGLFRGF